MEGRNTCPGAPRQFKKEFDAGVRILDRADVRIAAARAPLLNS